MFYIPHCMLYVMYILFSERIYLLKALWGGQHRRPSIYARHTVTDWRTEACNLKSATAGGRNHDDMSIYILHI